MNLSQRLLMECKLEGKKRKGGEKVRKRDEVGKHGGAFHLDRIPIRNPLSLIRRREEKVRKEKRKKKECNKTAAVEKRKNSPSF